MTPVTGADQRSTGSTAPARTASCTYAGTAQAGYSRRCPRRAGPSRSSTSVRSHRRRPSGLTRLEPASSRQIPRTRTPTGLTAAGSTDPSADSAVSSDTRRPPFVGRSIDRPSSVDRRRRLLPASGFRRCRCRPPCGRGSDGLRHIVTRDGQVSAGQRRPEPWLSRRPGGSGAPIRSDEGASRHGHDGSV